ncbi:transketolase [Ruminococcus sp. CLA-AA-H200]|uniref:Transketolase n=1 Tax=Ruminococcus turbiniformis TaxID=2881258 RepID=A0ABS8FTN2_9FIRM|nr:transketolase [Ruminococcus turbiniformis]MCC2253337.1 transketolase [Ruminococcus turbiniformis]
MGYDRQLINRLENMAKQIRRDIVTCVGVGVAGHIGGSNSSADIVTALYFYKMKHDPSNPQMKERDRFLLSKGHVGILQYSALAESGYFPVEDLKHVKELGFYLQGHPDVIKTPGIEAGTGSLGQGLSIGLGMALGQKLDGLDSKTYVLVGDGEIAEGQIWEAAMAASAFHADNLVAIVDRNRLQANGKVKERFDSGDIIAKFLSFGWNVIEIDGHNMEEILTALDAADEVKGIPTVIVANTVKGKGLSFAENVVGYHNGTLTEDTYRQAMEELA